MGRKTGGVEFEELIPWDMIEKHIEEDKEGEIPMVLIDCPHEEVHNSADIKVIWWRDKPF